MTPIHSGYTISGANVRSNDVVSSSKAKLTEAPNFQDQQQKFLEALYTKAPDTANHPAYQDYASIRVNGKVVAKIDNNGFVESSNMIGSKLLGQLPGAVNGKSGPMLANARAEKIAELLGGKVERSSTALTQKEFDSLPAPHASIDMAALKADPMYEQLQKSKQARSEFTTQQIAQDGDDEAQRAAAKHEAAVSEFLDFMSKTPEEKLFAAFLEKNGMTEEQFKMLPPEEQTKLMEEFKQELKAKALEGIAKSLEKTA